MVVKHIFKLVIILFFLFPQIGYSQCTGGTSSGALNPTNTWQTITVRGGRYYSFAASQSVQYTFSFCQGGGASSWDTQITILDNTGALVSGAYNDDYCGVNSHYIFKAPTSGNYRVYITQYNCASNSTDATLAFQRTVNDNPCSALSIQNPSCGTSYTSYSTVGATNTSSPGNPGCAGYSGNDVWFRTVVPFSGSLVISTQAGNITDGGMAAYRAATCSGPFTLLNCNDDAIGLMPRISLNSLTPGDSIFIRFWAKNNAQSGSFGLYVNDPNPTYCYTGSAVQNFSTGCIRVTPNLPAQSGCIWNKTKISLATSFNYFFYVNLGSDDAGADGLCFALQNSPAGMSALGTTGWNLGMGGIPNSVAIEFDTFNNGAGVNDIAADHTAISLNGNLGTPVAGPVQASSTNANIEDGVNHQVNIDWNAGTNTLRVYFDNVLRLTYVNDLVTNVFGGDPNVYWGFSGSTGSFTNTQTICPGSLPGNPLPVEWAVFEAVYNGSDVTLVWETGEEKNVKEFVIERSSDGISFSAVGSVDATGNSKTIQRYEYTDVNVQAEGIYYRIKEVDNEGKSSFSDIRYVDTSGDKAYFSLSPNPATSNEITLTYFNKAKASDIVIIYDQYGKEITRGFVSNGIQKIRLPDEIKSGIVHIVLITSNGTFNEKLIIASR